MSTPAGPDDGFDVVVSDDGTLTVPSDRFILATAAQLRLPLVTADRAMSNAHIVPIIW